MKVIVAPGRGLLRKIRFRNIRALRELVIDLSGSTTVIIGENGTCKSTILRSLVMAMCHRRDASALLSEMDGQLISEGADWGSVELWFSESTDVAEEEPTFFLMIERDGSREVVGGSRNLLGGAELFVCAYGAARGSVGRGSTKRGYHLPNAVATLFEYGSSIADPELNLRRLQDFMDTERYEVAMKGIRSVLRLTKRHKIDFERGGGVIISGPGIGKAIPLGAWADGYRMTLTWLLDFYSWALAADAIGPAGEVPGLLIVDEIEQHLHPKMQREVLAGLRRLFPATQLIVTTHSPLVALSAEGDDLVALHRRRDRVVRAASRAMLGYSAEDMLADEQLFATEPRSPKGQRDLARYRRLALKDQEERSPAEQKALDQLSEQLDTAVLPEHREDGVTRKLDDGDRKHSARIYCRLCCRFTGHLSSRK